jgi:hypothetical protein
MANNIEGSNASRIAKSAPSGSLTQLGLIHMAKDIVGGDSGKDHRKGQQFANVGSEPMTAERWHNMNVYATQEHQRAEASRNAEHLRSEGAKDNAHVRSEGAADTAHLRSKDLASHLVGLGGEGRTPSRLEFGGAKIQFANAPKAPRAPKA